MQEKKRETDMRVMLCLLGVGVSLSLHAEVRWGGNEISPNSVSPAKDLPSSLSNATLVSPAFKFCFQKKFDEFKSQPGGCYALSNT